MKSDIAIATLSLIRTPDESQTVLETIKAYSGLGIPVVVVDGGSAKIYKEKIKLLPNISFFETNNGLQEQLKISHTEASKLAEYIFYTHTDKLSFAKKEASKIIEFYRGLSTKGMLVPTRTAKSFATYPSYQQKAEKFMNWFIGEYLEHHTDYYAGPKIYPASLISHLDKIQGNIGWGFEAFFYVIAKRLSMPIDFLDVNFTAPADVESSTKTNRTRIRVVEWQIQGYLQGLETNL